MANKKVFKQDTQVKIISNTHAILECELSTGRSLLFRKIGTPKTISFLELEYIAQSNDSYIQEGLIYIPDKQAFEALDLDMDYETVKPLSEVKKMLELEAEDLRSQVKDLVEGSKDLLVKEALSLGKNLRRSTISVIKDETGIDINLIMDNNDANKQNQEKFKNGRK